MAAVCITAVSVLDNPSSFLSPLQFEIQYQAHCDLKHDLEFKLIYVGSSDSTQYDQELDSVAVGPVVAGDYRFLFQADPPSLAKLPPTDVVGVTVLLLTCSYQDKEFVRVGYYVSNTYDTEDLQENPPEKPKPDRLVRNILADKPRVTRFPCDFDSAPAPRPEPEAGGDGGVRLEGASMDAFGAEALSHLGSSAAGPSAGEASHLGEGVAGGEDEELLDEGDDESDSEADEDEAGVDFAMEEDL